MACKTGFRIKTYHGVATWKVTACEAVTNCSAIGEALNRCDNCTYLYDPVTDSVGTDPTTNCLRTREGHCFAGVLNGNTLICHICEPGYELMDSKCQIIKVPRCDSTSFSNNLTNSYNRTH